MKVYSFWVSFLTLPAWILILPVTTYMIYVWFYNEFSDYISKKYWNLNNLIKRCLLLGRKVMTNLDSIFKSRDISLPTKVHLVKAMVSPVVMYGCESWMWRKLINKELMLLNCGVREDSWEFLGLQGDPTSPS